MRTTLPKSWVRTLCRKNVARISGAEEEYPDVRRVYAHQRRPSIFSLSSTSSFDQASLIEQGQAGLASIRRRASTFVSKLFGSKSAAEDSSTEQLEQVGTRARRQSSARKQSQKRQIRAQRRSYIQPLERHSRPAPRRHVSAIDWTNPFEIAQAKPLPASPIKPSGLGADAVDHYPDGLNDIARPVLDTTSTLFRNDGTHVDADFVPDDLLDPAFAFPNSRAEWCQKFAWENAAKDFRVLPLQEELPSSDESDTNGAHDLWMSKRIPGGVPLGVIMPPNWSEERWQKSSLNHPERAVRVQRRSYGDIVPGTALFPRRSRHRLYGTLIIGSMNGAMENLPRLRQEYVRADQDEARVRDDERLRSWQEHYIRKFGSSSDLNADSIECVLGSHTLDCQTFGRLRFIPTSGTGDASPSERGRSHNLPQQSSGQDRGIWLDKCALRDESLISRRNTIPNFTTPIKKWSATMVSSLRRGTLGPTRLAQGNRRLSSIFDSLRGWTTDDATPPRRVFSAPASAADAPNTPGSPGVSPRVRRGKSRAVILTERQAALDQEMEKYRPKRSEFRTKQTGTGIVQASGKKRSGVGPVNTLIITSPASVERLSDSSASSCGSDRNSLTLESPTLKKRSRGHRRSSIYSPLGTITEQKSPERQHTTDAFVRSPPRQDLFNSFNLLSRQNATDWAQSQRRISEVDPFTIPNDENQVPRPARSGEYRHEQGRVPTNVPPTRSGSGAVHSRLDSTSTQTLTGHYENVGNGRRDKGKGRQFDAQVGPSSGDGWRSRMSGSGGC